MLTLKVWPFEAFFEVHSIPQRGLFRFQKSGRGELFIDFRRLSVTLTNLKMVADYYTGEKDDERKVHTGGPPDTVEAASGA
jgi:hypothetical protein